VLVNVRWNDVIAGYLIHGEYMYHFSEGALTANGDGRTIRLVSEWALLLSISMSLLSATCPVADPE
jgi:hypothetical protein